MLTPGIKGHAALRVTTENTAQAMGSGELPVLDRKYDILKHPALKLTEDGGAAPYIHHPGLTYALEDFPLSADSWESIEIIE